MILLSAWVSVSPSNLLVFFQYLTTVIPYEKKAGTPSVEDLHILTKSESLSLRFSPHVAAPIH